MEADVVVTSSAIKADNPEVIAAKESPYPDYSAGANVGGVNAVSSWNSHCGHSWENYYYEFDCEHFSRG